MGPALVMDREGTENAGYPVNPLAPCQGDAGGTPNSHLGGLAVGAFIQSFSTKSKVDGRDLPGSDEVDSTLALGGSIILGSGTLLDVQADIGLTSSAPDYAFLVSLPISFNLPIPEGF